MSEYGQCSDPSCNEMGVRLFDCAHHCMKLVCLQHLIEHDRLITYNEDYINNLRFELKQLWTVYSSLIDETKLRYEFEQKLKRHQQLTREISNLFEINSVNIEHYRLMAEKLKQNIEQEKQINPYSFESYPNIEHIKFEPTDITPSKDELDSFNVSLATRLERYNSNNTQQQQSSISNDSRISQEYDQKTNTTYDDEILNTSTIHSPSLRRLTGECPLWQDGAYGLTENSHGMYICPRRRHTSLYNHLIKYHKLKISSVEKICQAIQNKKDSFKEILFEPNDIVIDEINNYFCPFSIYNKQPIKNTDSSKHHCRKLKPLLSCSLRYHFIRDHHIPTPIADKIVQKLKTNLEN